MKLGIENKSQVVILSGLGLVAAYLLYTNLFSGSSSTPAPAARTGDSAAAVPGTAEKAPDASGPDISRSGQQASVRPGANAKSNDFHPVLRSKKKEERATNVAQQDPRLRLDLLAKVMQVPPAGGERDLFQILKTAPVKQAELVKGPEPKVYAFVGPRPPPPPPPPKADPPPPAPEPIPLKYYGYSTVRPDGKRTAYFLDGEDILEAIEGATLKGRYRIVQIGLDKVLVEDTQQKRRQSVNIEPEATG
jgi:hypothetical protein